MSKKLDEFVTKSDFNFLARISRTDLSGTTSARNALTQITGISHRLASAILRSVGVNEFALLGSLTDQEREKIEDAIYCLLYTSPSPRDQRGSRMPSSA